MREGVWSLGCLAHLPEDLGARIILSHSMSNIPRIGQRISKNPDPLKTTYKSWY
jgi:hypothetical protein